MPSYVYFSVVLFVLLLIALLIPVVRQLHKDRKNKRKKFYNDETDFIPREGRPSKHK